jgi:hypothetical protein
MVDPNNSSITKAAEPIFVVGSPRSGTSVLAWCLGHHANIFPVPESNWMGDFAVSLGVAHQIGSARDNRSMLSAMDIGSAELFAALGYTINDLTLRHRRHLQTKREGMGVEGEIQRRWLAATSTAAGPKTRWVDGTPEYSLYICGLRKLFPGALFIHLVRDVDSVVRSLLNFHRVAGNRLVKNEEEAYQYWLRRVKACLKAEEAYGPRVVHRLYYSALVQTPESAIRSLLDFVGEPYDAKCLEPLAERINSSNVPADFKSDDPATDLAIVEEARRLSAEIDHSAQPTKPSSAAADEMEASFEASCLKAKTLEEQIAKQRQHYLAEIDTYKMQIAGQQQHYFAEIDEYKSVILKQQQHYLAEIEEYKSQLARQEQHYTAESEEYKSQIARQEQYYGNRLHKQLQETKKLASLLDEVAKTAASLRSSGFWRLANKAATAEAKLFRHKGSVPDAKFERILARYWRWCGLHPEVAKGDLPTQAAGSSVPVSNSDAQLENASEIQSTHKVSGTSAEA